MIKLGRHDGFKTLNVVRRREAIDELKALGGDAVISSEDGPIDEQVRRIVGGDGVKHAIDPVGGETGTAVFRSLAPEGRLVLYGTLSGEPIQIDPRLMISGKRVVQGFWLGYWMRERSIPAALLLFREIAIHDPTRACSAPRSAGSTRSMRSWRPRSRPMPSPDTARSWSGSEATPLTALARPPDPRSDRHPVRRGCCRSAERRLLHFFRILVARMPAGPLQFLS